MFTYVVIIKQFVEILLDLWKRNQISWTHQAAYAVRLHMRTQRVKMMKKDLNNKQSYKHRTNT
jgi:hypothetical protein